MKHIKSFKMFENMQSAQTLRDLIGNVKTEISEYVVETDKGILVNGLSVNELQDYLLDEEISIEDEVVTEKGKNYPIYCLAFDDNEQIVAISTIPGDYMGSEFDGTTFKVYGHDGIEELNLRTKTQNFIDRGELDDHEYYS